MFYSCAPRSWAVRLRRPGLAGWIAAAAAVVSFDSAAADSGTGTLLYDANSNKLPSHSDWGWYFPPPLLIGGLYEQGMLSGATFLDTTASNGARAGYSLGGIFTLPQPNLNSTAGFALEFSLRVTAESHGANTNRAGFSIIVLDQSARGVELGFWTNEVWAQKEDFTHGESFAVDTQTAQRTYRVVVIGDNYSLAIDGTPQLSEPLRDYTSNGPDAVYGQQNYIFFGDDTTSAGARFELSNITLAPIPEPTEWALMLAGLGCVVAIARRRRPQPTLR